MTRHTVRERSHRNIILNSSRMTEPLQAIESKGMRTDLHIHIQDKTNCPEAIEGEYM